MMLILELLGIGIKFLDSSQVKTENQQVALSMELDAASIPMSSIVATLVSSKKAAGSMMSANNLKQIALGFHNFEATYKRLPNSQRNPNPQFANPKMPCSWRVAILPFIEQNQLYQQYKFDAPWDSKDNLTLLDKMPAVFRHPDAVPGSTDTCYVMTTDEETIFTPNKNADFTSITDGTSNTIMLVEAKTSIPWTKPEDFEYSAEKPLPNFGNFSSQVFNVAFADGFVRFLPKSTDEASLRSMLTARGGELVK